jgi:hypothetical protein
MLVPRIAAGQVLLQIREGIVVVIGNRVGSGQVAEHIDFPHVSQAVIIRIGVIRVGDGIGVEVVDQHKG